MLLEPVSSAESLRFVPLDVLELDDLNPRRDSDAESIASLAASIRAVGLIQNLSGRILPSGKIGVVAGGRRLAALRMLSETGEAPDLIPVRIASDAEEAEFWAHVENDQRKPLSAADEIVAFRQLAQQGKSNAEIAQVFGCAERRVAQRMKLAGLDDEIIVALRGGEITLDVAEVMTLAPSPQIALDVLAGIRSRGFCSVHWVRQELLRDRVASHDSRAVFVGAAAYLAAGGKITEDLFGGSAFFEDASLLQKLCDEKLALAVEDAIGKEGWLWAEASREALSSWDLRRHGLSLLEGDPAISDEEREELDDLWNSEADEDEDDGEDEDQALVRALRDRRIELEDLAQKRVYSPAKRAVSGVVVWIARDGKIGRLEGLVRKADATAAAGVTGQLHPDGATAPKATDAAPFSAALLADLNAIRLASVQAALAKNDALALDILGFELSNKFCRMLDVCLRETANRPANADGFVFPPELEAPEDALDFDAYRQLPQAERTRRLTRGVAVLLTKGWRCTDEFETVAAECGADARKVWSPTTEGFWKRITSGQIDATIRSLLGWTDEGEDWKVFSRMKKGAKAEIMGQLFVPGSQQRIAYRVTPEQEAAIDAWTPPQLRAEDTDDA